MPVTTMGAHITWSMPPSLDSLLSPHLVHPQPRVVHHLERQHALPPHRAGPGARVTAAA